MFPSFQRTRGVLRLLANVIEGLYQREVNLHMMLPGDVNLDHPSVRREFLKYIGHDGERVLEASEAVVDRDEVEKSLRLSPQMGVGEGDAIALRLWDADTGDLLAQQPTAVQVDLDR